MKSKYVNGIGPTFQELCERQAHNKKKFDDIFKKIHELEQLNWPKEKEQGALFALDLLHNYILNREIDKNEK